jgi:hypothetical protein
MRVHLLAVVIVACSRNQGTQPIVRPDDVPDATALSPSPSPKPIASSPSVCAADSDCHWNDECFATKCLPGPRPPFIGCDESAPKPGACRCLAGTCATVYAKTSGSCSADSECDWDDDCMPKKCEKRPKRAPTGCDKSYPAPGACLCVNTVCASVAKAP